MTRCNACGFDEPPSRDGPEEDHRAHADHAIATANVLRKRGQDLKRAQQLYTHGDQHIAKSFDHTRRKLHSLPPYDRKSA